MNNNIQETENTVQANQATQAVQVQADQAQPEQDQSIQSVQVQPDQTEQSVQPDQDQPEQADVSTMMQCLEHVTCDFYTSVANQYRRKGRLSPKQVDAIRNMYETQLKLNQWKPTGNTFINSLRDNFNTRGRLSVNQIASLERSIERYNTTRELLEKAKPFNLLQSFQAQFDRAGSLSEKQLNILKDNQKPVQETE